jgi:hypothetical protein
MLRAAWNSSRGRTPILYVPRGTGADLTPEEMFHVEHLPALA